MKIFRRAGKMLLMALLLLSGLTTPAAGNVAAVSLHWLGLNQFDADTNASNFLDVWNLPQTRTLLAQTLDKISRLPGHGATNAASALIRPLLDDLVASEFYLEMFDYSLSAAGAEGSLSDLSNHQSSIINHPFLLAVRLSPDHARLWQTNTAALAQLFKSRQIEFSRGADWTIISLGKASPAARSVFAARIKEFPSPARTSPWLEADLNPAVLGNFDSRFLSLVTRHMSLAHIHLTLANQTNTLHTLARFDLVRPLTNALPAWEIPTNLIHGPLTSFTAARGFVAWLDSFSAWQKLNLSPTPDQAFVWAQAGIPLQTYLAAPLPAASNQLYRLAPRLVKDVNPWLATNADGSLSWSDVAPGIVWNDANLMTPFLLASDSNHKDYLLAGMYPPPGGPFALPPVRVREAMGRHPNLLFCQLEGTGTRVDDQLFNTQLVRLVMHHPQMTTNALGTLWLRKINQSLGESFTTVTRATPGRLVLERHSTVGFTALELHLLADWLESPQFPRGLHTLLAPPDKFF